MAGRFWLFIAGWFFALPVQSQLVYDYMDLQIHPTMSFVYSFFGKGYVYFDENNPPQLTYKHQFVNVNYANYLRKNKGARIIVNGAINSEYVTSPKKARKIILEQIEYVNEFASRHPEDFVVAKTPAEVRNYWANTDKTIIIHSIEGGKELIHSQEDADFWASKGVAFITLIHLVDCEYGGAATLPILPTRIINRSELFHSNAEPGLTELGKSAIVWMANAGIMTDITHMSDLTRKQALAFMEEMGIPAISTHDGFKPIQNHPRALDENDIRNIYRGGGFISLPVSGMSLKPYHPDELYRRKIDSLELYCDGSIDTYKFTYLVVKNFIEHSVYSNVQVDFKDLAEEEKINFCIGFQSDFNGWLDHSRPRYGTDGCYEGSGDSSFSRLENLGLAHPGLMEEHWKLLEKEGVDLSPVKRASEKFLRLWEHFLSHRGTFRNLHKLN